MKSDTGTSHMRGESMKARLLPPHEDLLESAIIRRACDSDKTKRGERPRDAGWHAHSLPAWGGPPYA